MKYYIKRNILGSKGIVDISEKEFYELKHANEILKKFYSLTRNYRVVVESYRNVEIIKHDVELNQLLYARYGHNQFYDDSVALNSSIIGYLANSRYFNDSTDKIHNEIISQSQIDYFKKFRSAIYDSVFEYRFIEKLRNYSLHKDLPIHSSTYHNYIEDPNDIENSDKVSLVSLFVSRDELKKDKKFEKATATWEDMPETIDLIFCIRYHMENLWKIHNHLIQSHSQIANEARDVILTMIEHFVTNTGEESLGLFCFAQETDNEIAENFSLSLTRDDTRTKAIKEIGNLNNLHKRYITGKIKKIT
jgi:hypothetical protein